MNNIKKIIFAAVSFALAVTLASCGTNGTGGTGASTADPAAHTHVYGESWEKDGELHWKFCACGEKSEEASHTYNNGKCSVCGIIKASDGLVYEKKDGEYHVVGIGTCKDTKIVIPVAYEGLPVTAIANNAFFNNTDITSVTLGENIVSIGQSAFSDCTSLASVTFNEKLEKIEFGAFFKCTSLKTVSFPESIKLIGSNSFFMCSSLNSIKIPDNNCQIDFNAFGETGYYNSQKNWKDGVLYIGKYLIVADRENCPEKIIVKEGTKYIAASAFRELRYPVAEVILPESVVSIGPYAFYGSSIVKIDLPHGLERIEEYTFAYCGSLGEINIPLSVKFIGNCAFSPTKTNNVINYEGTLLQWKEIVCEADALPYFTKIICTDGEIILSETN
jgi:hypothetical protein